MPRQLTNEEAAANHGLTFPHRQMDNGEFRFCLVATTDGGAYIRTVTGSEGGWQNSHFHKGAVEWYAVQSGRIAFAELQPDGTVKLTIIEAGGTIESRPNVAHNLYMFADTVVHTVKYGKTDLKLHPDCSNPDKGADWWPAAQVDTLTRDARLNMEQILSMDEFRQSQETEDGFLRFIYVSEGGNEVGIKKK